MNRPCSKWQRLGITLSVAYLLIILGITAMYFPMDSFLESPCAHSRDIFCEQILSDAMQRYTRINLLLRALVLWIVPVVAVYVLVRLCVWTYKGFKH